MYSHIHNIAIEYFLCFFMNARKTKKFTIFLWFCSRVRTTTYLYTLVQPPRWDATYLCPGIVNHHPCIIFFLLLGQAAVLYSVVRTGLVIWIPFCLADKACALPAPVQGQHLLQFTNTQKGDPVILLHNQKR